MSVLDRPNAEQVLARIACLFLQVLRMELDLQFQEAAEQAEKEELREEYDEYLESLGEDPFMIAATAPERLRLLSPLGSWSEEDMIATSFGMDALPPLLFAIQLMEELPPHDETVEEFDEALNDFEATVGKAKFRPWDDLHEARATIEEMINALPEEPETEEQEVQLAVLEARLAGFEWLDGEFQDWEEA